MDIKVGDKVILKKSHPCGNAVFTIFRTGLDFKLKCDKCGRELMIPRVKILKSIKKVVADDAE